jgi:hypothetical protein
LIGASIYTLPRTKLLAFYDMSGFKSHSAKLFSAQQVDKCLCRLSGISLGEYKMVTLTASVIEKLGRKIPGQFVIPD